MQKHIIRAEKQKLSEFKTQFSDLVVEEKERLKAQVNRDHEQKLNTQRLRREYASSVKKPKVDETLREKLINEI